LLLACGADDTIPEHLAARPADIAQASPVDLQRTCLEEHEKLMQVNPENVARFKDVTRFLAQDLKNAEAGKA
jgi:hypothetical protein